MKCSRYLILLLSILIYNESYSQRMDLLNRFSFKASYSFTVNQYGSSPFSDTRPFNTGINSILYNLQYAHPVKNNLNINVGFQLVEKGFQLKYTLIIPKAYEQISEVQRRLHYLEMPVTLSYRTGKYNIIAGLAACYLYSHDLRFIESLKTYYPNSSTIKQSSISYFAVPDIENKYNKWDFGGLIGVSRSLGSSFEVEAIAQKQFIYANNFYPKNIDIAYFITLSAGLRYKFL